MTTDPAAAPAANPPIRIQRFPATRDQPCGSPWECPGILDGQLAAYVGMPAPAPGEKSLKRVCEPCANRLEVEFGVTSEGVTAAPSAITASSASSVNGHAGPAPEELTAGPAPVPPHPDSFEAAEPHRLVMPPEGDESSADLVPWTGPLCDCTSRVSGFARDPETGRWVHTVCGNPALRYEDGRDDAEHLHADSAFAGEPDLVGDDPVDDAEPDDDAPDDDAPGDEDVPDWHECDCARVTKRATFGRTPDGRYTHEHCGGLVREKHIPLAVAADDEGRVAGTRPETAEETPSDDLPVPAASGAGTVAELGGDAGPAASGVLPGEPAPGGHTADAADPAVGGGSERAAVGADRDHDHPDAAGSGEAPAAGGAPDPGVAPRPVDRPVGAAEGAARGYDGAGEGTRGVGEGGHDRGGESGGRSGSVGGDPAQPSPLDGVPGAFPGGEAVRPEDRGEDGPGVRGGAPAPERLVANGSGHVGPTWWAAFLDSQDIDDAVTGEIPIHLGADYDQADHAAALDRGQPVPPSSWEATAPRTFSGGAAAVHAAQLAHYAQATPNGHTPYGYAPGAPVAPTPATAPDPTAGMSDAERARHAITNTVRVSPADFMANVPAPVMRGNTSWASAYAGELVGIVTHYSNNRARSVQRHLGPSEIGHKCDRQVVGKLVGIPATNHVVDPWPSLMGTWGHAGLEEVFEGENTRIGGKRWHTERKVTPRFTDHPGTADLYDAATCTLGDHKFLGQDSMEKVRSAAGPPIHYVVQMLTYADGYRRLGFRVDRVALIAWPRTGSTLDGVYVWERAYTAEDEALLQYTDAQLHYRKQWANKLFAGEAHLLDVPAMPDDSDCYFCPFYRPQSATDGGPGCPGTVEPGAPAEAVQAAAQAPAGI